MRFIEMPTQWLAQTKCLVTGNSHHVDNPKNQITPIVPNSALGVHYGIQVRFCFPNYVLSGLVPLNT